MSSPNLTWSSLKTLATVLYAQYIGSGKLLDGDTGSPSSLALVVDLVCQRIVGYPYEWDFLKVKSSFSITGSSTYDLATLFPDLISVYQIYGINSNQESRPLADYDANVYPFYDSYQIVNNDVIFTGDVPVAGTSVFIQYKSQYMVIDGTTGLRKRYFENDEDYIVLRPGQDNVLIYGIGEFVDWMGDSRADAQRKKCEAMFQNGFNNLLLGSNPVTSEVHSIL